MNHINVRKTAIIVGSALTGYLVVNNLCRWDLERTRRKQKQKDLMRDLALNCQAIGRAEEIVKQRMLNPEYLHKGLAYAMEDLRNEIEFQKIALQQD
jgi:hypothetical protein